MVLRYKGKTASEIIKEGVYPYKIEYTRQSGIKYISLFDGKVAVLMGAEEGAE